MTWLALLLALPGLDDAPPPRPIRAYVGTYTEGSASKGIYLIELDLASGKLTSRGLAGEAVNPSFVALHPGRAFLYAVNEVGDFQGEKTGAVTAFAIDPDQGTLTTLNQQSSKGSGPCHLTVDRDGHHVLVANYGSGSVAVLPIGGDGRLAEASAAIQHAGKGTNPRRQEGPHAHSINLDGENHFAVAADLGLDRLFVYKFDPKAGTLQPNTPPYAEVEPGSGPRHFAFHPNGRHAYVINEMANTVNAFRYDPGRGILNKVQTIPTLPEGFQGTSHTAEVRVHPTGRFLYGSNRGHDSIAVFSLDPETGLLLAQGHTPTQGKTPRNFAIDPTGRYLLAANQGSDSIVVFRIDPNRGTLEPAGSSVEVPRPVCIAFLPIDK
jgi:6-phosphogluconolactonase